MHFLKILAVVAVVAYLLVVVVFFTTQRRLIYYPTHRYTPPGEVAGADAFREIAYRTGDGIDLKAWYAPATTRALTIVFFHGNADNLAADVPVAAPYLHAGYGFVLAEYRGYSGMAGTPSESALYRDAGALLRRLAADGVDAGHMVLFGHSLGTGVAVEMAAEFHPRGLMLLAPYLSLPKVGQPELPFLPVSLLALDRFDNEKKIASVHVPVLIANGAADEVIPPLHGKRLAGLANEPKEFDSIAGCGHNDAFDEFATLSLNWMSRRF